MGFYGNITNTSKTTFQFDRIYPNRVAMEAGTNNDGIFLGRYVLIEYENGKSKDTFVKCVAAVAEGEYYKLATSFKEGEPTNFLTYNENIGSQFNKQNTNSNLDVNKDWIAYIETGDNENGDSYYICIGEDGSDNHYALFKLVTTTTSEYKANYDIDLVYGDSKGYDSTVWVKTSLTIDDKLKVRYVSIADLNTVVPTFDLTIDAPTGEPLTPHFDTDSTNVYYKLHVQPNWGFQVGQATESTQSDEMTYWTRMVKAPDDSQQTYKIQYAVLDEDNKIIWQDSPPSKDNINIPATIYYNKDGFKPYSGTNVGGVNTINLLPTGISEKSRNEGYNAHNKINQQGLQKDIPDIQQLTINLPVIGNTIADVWDLVHGKNRDDNPTDSLQGRIDFFTGNVISNPTGQNIERDEVGAPIKTAAGIAKNEIPVQSSGGYLVGSQINGANNWIEEDIEGGFTLETLNDQGFNQDDPWIETKIDASNIDENKYHINGISIHHTFHNVDDSDNSVELNDTSNSSIDHEDMHYDITGGTIDLYVPKVDQMGHVVGKHIETITLPYSFKKIGIQNSEGVDSPKEENGEPIVAECSMDSFVLQGANRWIKLNADNERDDYINIGHKLLVKDEEAAEDSTIPNTNYGLISDLDIATLDKNNIFEIPVIKFDEAGHITKAETHTVTLPENFNKIALDKTNSENVEDYSVLSNETLLADSLTDTLTFGEGNKWLKLDTDVENDKVIFSHYVNKFDISTAKDVDFDSSTAEEQFTAVDSITWDEAGHLTEARKSTYTLPKAYQLITTENSDAVTTHTMYTDAKSKAETIRDGFALNSGNRWINIQNNDRVITIEHGQPNNSGVEIKFVPQTPAFGAEFSIPNIYYDQAGHIYDDGISKVTIPQSADVVNSDYKQILTGLSYSDKSTNKLAFTSENVNNFTLTDYNNVVLIEGTEKADIGASDTLGQALKKLQNNITMINGDSTTNGSIKKAIADVINNAPEAYDTLKEVADWIANDESGAAAMAFQINVNKLAIETNKTDIEQKLADSISIIDATFKNYYTQEEVDNFLASKQDQIEGLEATIADLTNRITALENTSTTE